MSATIFRVEVSLRRVEPRLELKLDESQRPAVGERLRGTVHVESADSFRDCTVHLAAKIKLHDFGGLQPRMGTYEESTTTLDVSGADLAFMLPALRGPRSYRGRRVELSWSVVATLQRETEVLARAEVPITVGEVVTSDDGDEPLDYRGYALRRDGWKPSFGPGRVEGLAARPADPVRDWINRVLFGRHESMSLDVKPPRVRRGGDVEVTVTVDVREPTVIEGIAAWLVEYEGPQVHLLTYAGEIEDQPSRHQLSGRARLEAGTHRYATRVSIPRDAAPTYAVGFVCIAWIVRVTVQFDGKPELVRDWQLGVY